AMVDYDLEPDENQRTFQLSLHHVLARHAMSREELDSEEVLKIHQTFMRLRSCVPFSMTMFMVPNAAINCEVLRRVIYGLFLGYQMMHEDTFVDEVDGKLVRRSEYDEVRQTLLTAAELVRMENVQRVLPSFKRERIQNIRLRRFLGLMYRYDQCAALVGFGA